MIKNFSLLIAASFAVGSFFSSPSSAQTSDLEAVIAKKILVLDRPLLTFHYRHWANDPTSAQEVLDLARGATTSFFHADLDHDPNMAGPGFYVAVDPAATRSYGSDSNPQLYAVTLKKGARLLDARYGNPSDQSPEEKAAEAKLKCFPEGEFHSLRELRNSSSLDCQTATLQALKNLKVDAILYDYMASNSLQSCRPSRGVALNIISTTAFDDNGVSFYSDRSSFNSNLSLAPKISALFKEADLDPNISLFNSSLPNLPSTIQSGDSVSDEDYQAFKSNFIWKCGSVRPGEWQADDLFNFYRQRATGSDFNQALSNAMSAYNLKSGTSNAVAGSFPSFDLSQMRAIVLAQYRLSGLASDDSKINQWSLAVATLRKISVPGTPFADFLAGWEKMAELLEEKNRTMTEVQKHKMDKIMTNRTAHLQKDPFTAYPGYYPNLLLRIGAGKRTAQIMGEMILPIPFITVSIPMDLSQDQTNLSNQNRNAVLDLVKKCTVKYQDPSLTMQDISASECGMIPMPSATP